MVGEPTAGTRCTHDGPPQPTGECQKSRRVEGDSGGRRGARPGAGQYLALEGPRQRGLDRIERRLRAEFESLGGAQIDPQLSREQTEEALSVRVRGVEGGRVRHRVLVVVVMPVSVRVRMRVTVPMRVRVRMRVRGRMRVTARELMRVHVRSVGSLVADARARLRSVPVERARAPRDQDPNHREQPQALREERGSRASRFGRD